MNQEQERREGNNALSSEEAHEQVQEQQIEREKLEEWATDQVKPWRELQTDDYDFRSWATDASKQRLEAGCVYEYARESRKLRCLLALINPKRKREDWEMVRPAMVDGKRPDKNNPAAATPLPCSFKNLDEHDAERTLGGFLYCLCDLAEYLADNISFGELFRTNQNELQKAFGGLDKLLRVKREFRYFLPVVDALGVATQSEAWRTTVSEMLSDDAKRMICGEACSEVIAMRIRWRFTDSEIAGALKRFLCAHRPRNEPYKARQRKKGSRRDSVQAALNCLSAMRLASYFPKTVPPPTPGMLAAWQSGASAELKQSAIEVFDAVRLGGRGKHIAESNFDSLIVEARELFHREFPLEGDSERADIS